jgi:hypothetical protein
MLTPFVMEGTNLQLATPNSFYHFLELLKKSQ